MEIEHDSLAKPTAESRFFLFEDPSIVCDVNDPAYSRLRILSVVLFAIWPIGVPLLFLLVLLSIRGQLLRSRSTVATRTTAFLHKEYDVCVCQSRPRGLDTSPVLLRMFLY